MLLCQIPGLDSERSQMAQPGQVCVAQDPGPISVGSELTKPSGFSLFTSPDPIIPCLSLSPSLKKNKKKTNVCFVCRCVLVCVPFTVFQIEWWHDGAKDTITMATSGDKASVRGPSSICCVVVWSSSSGHKNPFLHSLSPVSLYSVFFSLGTICVCCLNEQLPSFHGTGTDANHGVGIYIQ